MPPKDTPHALFFSTDDGETYKPIGKVPECGLVVDDLVPDKEIELPFIEPDEEFVVSCKFSLSENPSAFMFLATGKWPSNNWLRLHGFPMRRRRKRK